MIWIVYVLSPVLMHLVFSEGVTIFTSEILDSAACTALSSFLMLPAAIWMYRQDADLRIKRTPKHEAHREKQLSARNIRHKTRCGTVWSKQQKDVIDKHQSIPAGRIQYLGWYAGCFLAGGLLNVIWSGILLELGIFSAFSNQTQEALLGSQMATQIIGPGFLVPIVEELVFRGLVYERMKTRLSVRQAVFFSALLFALYHGNPIQMIYAFPMALLLALLYERGDGLGGSILFHMGANLTAIFFSY